MAVLVAPDPRDPLQAMPLMLNAGTNLGLSGPPFDVTDDTGVLIQSDFDWPADPDRVPLPFVDTGVYVTQLSDYHLLPEKLNYTDEVQLALRNNPEAAVQIALDQREKAVETDTQNQIPAATYRNTQINLTKSYDMVEQRYRSFMDVANFEPIIPSPLALANRRKFYAFTKPLDEKKPPSPGDDRYPPHLDLAGNPMSLGEKGGNQDPKLSPGHIFNLMRMAQLATLLPAVVPRAFLEDPLGAAEDTFKDLAKDVICGIASMVLGQVGNPSKGAKIADVENYNTNERQRRASFFHHKDIFDKPNIGDLPDWFTDARFAQQQFTGTNPTTITRVENVIKYWIDHFVQAATVQMLTDMKAKLVERAAAKSLYVQDYSYFRRAAGIGPDIEMSYTSKGRNPTTRYSIASVCIFNLQENGKLHPLGIVIDWRGLSVQSVTIFNKKLELPKYEQLEKKGKPVKSDQEKQDDEKERHDWAWRYAKTCVQTSDWLRHEVTVHLTNTHLIEEATIVAANRSFEMEHPVYQLLYPHWQKTLSLNAAARDTLVPSVIVPIVGMPDAGVYKFIRSAYADFDFEGSYAPKDLERRGFPVAELNSEKFHNYAWARCIHSMWYKIRKYVEGMLSIPYYGGRLDSGLDGDQRVRDDEQVMAWVKEMQNGAMIKTFPTISTFQGLVDCVTMCIHLASPQHTSVNYLQNFYQSFVINKPPALYNAPPKTLQQLQAFTEDDLVKALPMNHPQEWLLASHIPYLLSFKPGDKESLIIYALSKYQLAAKLENPALDHLVVRHRSTFYADLQESEAEFKKIGAQCDDSRWITYDVLSPSWNAVSILI